MIMQGELSPKARWESARPGTYNATENFLRRHSRFGIGEYCGTGAFSTVALTADKKHAVRYTSNPLNDGWIYYAAACMEEDRRETARNWMPEVRRLVIDPEKHRAFSLMEPLGHAGSTHGVRGDVDSAVESYEDWLSYGDNADYIDCHHWFEADAEYGEDIAELMYFLAELQDCIAETLYIDLHVMNVMARGYQYVLNDPVVLNDWNAQHNLGPREMRRRMQYGEAWLRSVAEKNPRVTVV